MQDTTISRYRVLEKLGVGGMGVVYKAEDELLGRFVALKFLPPELAHDEQMRDRFMREARAASALNHPNICTIYDVIEEDGKVCIAMEHLDGETLRELVEIGPLPLDRLLEIAVQVADGLIAAHREGIIHRDIKLANIIVTRKGPAKILDFGLAKKCSGKPPLVATGGIPETHLTSGLAALGTAAYMSPEQALGKPLDARTDIFSLGIVLYELATGKAPFAGDTTGMLFLSIVQENPVPPRDLNPICPSELQRIIGKCLEKDREFRYQSATELRADLARLQRDSGSHQFPALLQHEPYEAEIAERGLEPEPKSAPRDGSRVAVSEDEEKPVRRSWKAALSATLTVLLLMSTVGIYLLRSHRAHALKAQDGIVIADFANTTGEPIFDGSLRQALGVDLAQSPYLNVVPYRRIASILQEMEKSPNERLSREVAREVCLRTNSAAFVAGTIDSAGEGYRLELKAMDCSSDRQIASVSAKAKNRNDVLQALDGADKDLRRELGESLKSVQQFNRRLPEATTSSLEALKAYATARTMAGTAEEIPYLQHAIELDPNFAMAYAELGSVYRNARENEMAARYRAKAYELRNRVTELERFNIEIAYYRDVTGETAKAVATGESGIKAYPENASLMTFLGFSYLEAGELEKATQLFEQTRRLVPERASTYPNLMAGYVAMDRLDEAKIAYEEARKRNLDNSALRTNRFQLAFLEGDDDEMRLQLEETKGKPVEEDRVLAVSSAADACHGQLRKAHELLRQAVASAERAGGHERMASYNASASLVEAEFGNHAEARKKALAAGSFSGERELKQILALSLARAGDVHAAQTLADELARDYPSDTRVQSLVLPAVLSSMAMQRGQPDKAIELLKPAIPLELSSTDFVNMECSYLRGLAYLQLHRGSEAAAEFEKIVQHPGLVSTEVIGSLAHLQLARAYEMGGKHDAARTEYQDFLAIWKDADPNVPVYQQARAEYAKLH